MGRLEYYLQCVSATQEKEIKKEEEERLREWYRPREDLACDDSQVCGSI